VLFSDNPALLPFIPLVYGGDTEQMLQRCVMRIRQELQAPELEAVLALFASYVMDTTLIRRILRWEMGIIRESPLAAEIYEEGLREGKQEGRQEGIEEGKYEAAVEWLGKVLAIRFQVNDLYLEGLLLQQYDLETLQGAAEFALIAPTLQAFEDFLKSLT
jgi:predicted transposase YdaD